MSYLVVLLYHERWQRRHPWPALTSPWARHRRPEYALSPLRPQQDLAPREHGVRAGIAIELQPVRRQMRWTSRPGSPRSPGKRSSVTPMINAPGLRRCTWKSQGSRGTDLVNACVTCHAPNGRGQGALHDLKSSGSVRRARRSTPDVGRSPRSTPPADRCRAGAVMHVPRHSGLIAERGAVQALAVSAENPTRDRGNRDAKPSRHRSQRFISSSSGGPRTRRIAGRSFLKFSGMWQSSRTMCMRTLSWSPAAGSHM
jgi:hypothetical protein